MIAVHRRRRRPRRPATAVGRRADRGPAPSTCRAPISRRRVRATTHGRRPISPVPTGSPSAWSTTIRRRPSATRASVCGSHPSTIPASPPRRCRSNRAAGDVYEGSGPNLSFEGRWKVAVLIERARHLDRSAARRRGPRRAARRDPRIAGPGARPATASRSKARARSGFLPIRSVPARARCHITSHRSPQRLPPDRRTRGDACRRGGPARAAAGPSHRPQQLHRRGRPAGPASTPSSWWRGPRTAPGCAPPPTIDVPGRAGTSTVAIALGYSRVA